MVTKKILTATSSHKKEISLVYKSATDSAIISTFSNRRQYERVGKADSSETRGPKAPKNLKLGGNSAARVCRNRLVKLQCLFRAPCNLVNKVKSHYAALKEAARNSNLKVSDLFAGNQLLMHVNAAPVKCRKRPLKPSEGFVSRVKAPVGHHEMRER